MPACLTGVIEVAETFGEWLKMRRKAAGLGGAELAAIAGTDRSNLHNIETGKRRASDASLEMLASVPQLGVTLDELKAWRDYYEIGPEAARRMVKIVPGAGAGEPWDGIATPEELDLIAQAREVGVWSAELEYPHTWKLSAEERDPLFEMLGELIEVAQRRKKAQGQ